MIAIELLEPTGLGALPRGAESTIYQRSPDLVSREIGGETVVVPICRGVGDLDSIFTFNAVGTFLWELLANAKSETELTQAVTEEFEVSEDVALRDVRNFLTELRDAGLVRKA